MIREIVSGKSKIEERIKLRNLYCAFMMILGVVSICVGIYVPLDSGNAEYSSGFYVGLGCGVTIAAMLTIIKNLRLLKNQEALQERDIYESDERNRLLGLKSWSYAGYAMFILLYIAMLFAGAINVVVMNTLLVTLGIFALCLFISKTMLKMIM